MKLYSNKCNMAARVWGQLETLLYQNMGKIQIQTKLSGMVRGMKTSQGSLKDTKTHIHTLTGGLCWYRSVLLQGLVPSPCWLKRYPYPVAQSWHLAQTNVVFTSLLSDYRFSSPALISGLQHQHEGVYGSSVSVIPSHHCPHPFIMHEKYKNRDLPRFQDNDKVDCTLGQ